MPFKIRCPDFPHLRHLAPPGLPMLNGEIMAKIGFCVWWGAWGFEVVP